MIDECNLLQAVLKAAYTRRYGAQLSNKNHLTAVKQNMTASQSTRNINAFGSPFVNWFF